MTWWWIYEAGCEWYQDRWETVAHGTGLQTVKGRIELHTETCCRYPENGNLNTWWVLPVPLCSWKR